MSNYPHGRSQTGHSTAGLSEHDAQRVRYMAHMERRARPPTFRPLTIVVVVLSLGLFVIGLVMIVIAHWPGVSGGESLKIAGGVLLSVGGIIFIIAMVVTCVVRNRERERFEKSIASMQASRSNISVISRRTQMTATPTPSIDAKPAKSILKKTPSTSTYGTNRGSVFGDGDSGQHSFGQNHSYDQGGSSNTSDTSAGKYEVYRIETMPDPSQAKRGKNGSLPQNAAMNLSGSGAGGMLGMGISPHTSSDSEAQVIPTAVRQTKKRRAQSPSVASGRTNPSYSQDPDDMNASRDSRQAAPTAQAPPPVYNPGYDQPKGYPTGYDQAAAPPAQAAGRQMKDYSQDGGYDMYAGDGAVPTPVRKKRAEKKRKPQAAPDQYPAHQASDPYPGFQNEAFAPQEVDLGGPPVVHQHITSTQHVTRTTRQTRPAHDTSLNASAQSDELKINIKAQPGTAVHITPTGTRKQRAPRTVASPSQSSVETVI